MAEWKIAADPDLSGYADAGPDLPMAIKKLLVNRGIDSTLAARIFMQTPKDLTQDELMPNLSAAVSRLKSACEHGERVTVFGDYDVDGITASVLLVEGLNSLGANVDYYIPDRRTEGYGPNVRSIRRVSDLGTSLLITADTGTSAIEEIDEANELSMDVVVIDHHSIPAILPNALAIVNPLLNDNEYGSEPAAVGVAYKVLRALFEEMRREFDDMRYIELVCLGLVCDLAPLKGESRSLVRLGLDAIRRSKRPGIKALCKQAGIKESEIDSEAIGWKLGPRLNAAGRMAHASLSFDLLDCDDPVRADALAKSLERLNDDRRSATEAAVELSRKYLTDMYGEELPPLVIVASDEIHAGIAGICASRLVEKYGRPAIVIDMSGEEARASCRSVGDFDLVELLNKVSSHLIKFGGHRAAAGFSAELSNVAELQSLLLSAAAQVSVSRQDHIRIDMDINFEEMTDRMFQYLDLLEPHGVGNPRPVFVTSEATMTGARSMGQNGAHLRASFVQGTETWDAVGWNIGEYSRYNGRKFDLVYSFRRTDPRFRRTALQLRELDVIALRLSDTGI